MNRLILKYGHPITVVILAVFAWVVYRRISSGGGIIPLAVVAVPFWAIGAPILSIFGRASQSVATREQLSNTGSAAGQSP